MNFKSLFTSKKPVRVRMAPSPTGTLHIGTARTVIMNYLFAKKEGGVFVMRIEDTDRERSRPEFEKDILDGLTWLGLTWDEFYRQSERTDVYRDAIQTLIKEDKAYISKEPAKDESGRMVEVVRLRNQGGALTFQDLVRGDITTDTTELGDFVIARAVDDPLYHLAVVIDDGIMGITHVIRGDDHISNTARQILILEALGYERPIYAHVPLVLAPDRSKLSKRHGATALAEYKDQGFIPEGLVNFLALLGWNPGGEKEVFTIEELIAVFDLTKLQTGGAVFDIVRLKWFNREHLKRLTPEDFTHRLEVFCGHSVDPRMVPMLQGRVDTLKDAADLIASGEFSYLLERPTPEATLILPKAKGTEITHAEIKGHLEFVCAQLEGVPQSRFTEASVKEVVWPYAEEKGKGNVLWPMRVALTGLERSADPFSVAAMLGRTETLARLRAAVEIL